MTMKQKQAIVDQILELLTELVEECEIESPRSSKSVEMLTIKEAAEEIPGLSVYTVRMLVKQNKLSGVRTGMGKHGKILINKQEVLDYFGSQS